MTPTATPKDLIKSSGKTEKQLIKLAEANEKAEGDKPDVAWVQRGLGVPEADCDGVWGPQTVSYLIEWQKRNRFAPDGLLTVEQMQHFPTVGDAIPDAPHAPPTFGKTPASGKYSAYDQAFVGANVWPKQDPMWEAMTAKPTWLSGMLRLLTKRTWNTIKQVATYSRVPCDMITLDTYSLGIAHWWADTAPGMLAEMVERLPDLALECFGAACVELLQSPQAVKKVTGTATGPRRYNPRTLSWLAAGWWRMNKDPRAVAVQVELWAMNYIGEALEILAARNIKLKSTSTSGRILAAVARMCNTSPALARRCMDFVVRYANRDDEGAVWSAIQDVYKIPRDKGGYDKDGNGETRLRIIEACCGIAPSLAVLKQDWQAACEADLDLCVAAQG